jgi:hemerythrin
LQAAMVAEDENAEPMIPDSADVGIEFMRHRHQVILSHLAKMRDICVSRPAGDTTLSALLGGEFDQLTNASKELFAAEQRAMQRSGCPGAARHVLAHQRFLSLLTLHCRLLGHTTSAESCLEFLGHTAPTWWRLHIEQLDSAASAFMFRYEREHPEQAPLFD